MGISDATISRSLGDLREAGFLFGPENVDLWSLGLTVVLADFPNRRSYEEAFWEFPYTYTQMIPLSGSSRIHAHLVIPFKAVNDFRKLSKYGIRIGVVKRTLQKLKCGSLGRSLASMARAYLRSSLSPLSVRVRVTPPPVRLYWQDIRVLNMVMRDGRVTEQTLRKVGIRSAKQRLSKLREAGIIRRYYMVESPPGFDTVLIRVRCGVEEMDRLSETLGSMTTVLTQYVEGDERYCLAVALVRREVKSDILFGVRAIYGDDLELAEEILDIHTSWLLPEELWDQKRQTFSWEEPLNSLIDRLKS
ncbi:MAG: Lrp/AsnC family transcriptional regulator [Candidatus Korarchaeum sp.]|nr:Lrp/AsnC family transcriptional regulator [Candidatus Korarchaeum sp.]